MPREKNIIETTPARMKIECGGLTFISDFDSGNLDKVEFLSESSRNTVLEKSTSSSSSSSPSYLHNADVSKSTLRSSPNASELKKVKNASYTPQHGPVPKGSPFRKGAVLNNPSPTFKKNIKILEFRVWTKPDCGGTPFENQFRSWFHFGVEGGTPGSIIKIHVVNLNRQGKLYFYGMRPVYRILPGRETWKRIPGKVHYKSEADGNFAINFSHPLPSQAGSVLYFAFTYPFSYSACQEMLNDIDRRVGSSLYHTEPELPAENSIYYTRELLCYSLDGRRVELLTVTSFKGFTKEREARLPHLFPDVSKPRCHVFCDKKVIFLSSRVHPGETPSSFVFNGFLQNLLCPKDLKANKLRNLFVFKLIPLLNPDGVWRGHFRTDSRGVNLNRTYLIANPELHPSVYAARSLLLHYHVLYSSPAPIGIMHDILKENCNASCQNHFSESKKLCALNHKVAHKPMISDMLKASSEIKLVSPASSTLSVRHSAGGSLCVETSGNVNDSVTACEALLDRSLSVSDLCLSGGDKTIPGAASEANYLSDFVSTAALGYNSLNCSESWRSGSTNESPKLTFSPSYDSQLNADAKPFRSCSDLEASDVEDETASSPELGKTSLNTSDVVSYINPDSSGVAYYIDLHGHACKRGCFIYGNHFNDLEQKVECMLLAKLLSINTPYFDFGACNFTAENMRSGGKREGQSKEGSGRVALHTLTGIIHSYTLECNYNTGRSYVSSLNYDSVSPEKSIEYFSPAVYEQVGEALLVSILDATGFNPHSSVGRSSLGSLEGVRDWLRKYAISVHSKSKNDFLKRNMLNARMTKVNPKDKSALSSPTLSTKFVNKGSQQKHESRVSCLASNVKRNIHSPPVSNEKFLSDFGLKCKRLHASSPSLDHFNKSSSKCLDSLKNLLNPKSKPFSSVKSSSSKAAPLRTPPKKSKMGRLNLDKSEIHQSTRELATESLAENHRKSRSNTSLAKAKGIDRGLEDIKGKKLLASSVPPVRKVAKPKKKGIIPSFQSSEAGSSTNLLKSDGNLRLKKMSKKLEKS